MSSKTRDMEFLGGIKKWQKKNIFMQQKRKSSIARVNIIPGTGKITINKKDLNDIYSLDTLKAIVLKPFTVANMMEKYDVEATVHGGGFAGQAGVLFLTE